MEKRASPLTLIGPCPTIVLITILFNKTFVFSLRFKKSTEKGQKILTKFLPEIVELKMNNSIIENLLFCFLRSAE